MSIFRLSFLIPAALLLAGCDAGSTPSARAAAEAQAAAEPATPAAARAFVAEAEAEARAFSQRAARTSWVQSTYITHDTRALLADIRAEQQSRQLRWAHGAARFDGLEVDFDTRRKLDLLKQGFVLPPPAEPALSGELARLRTEMPAAYSSYEYCRSQDECLTFEDMNLIMGSSRDPEELLEIWTRWRDVSPGYKDDYARLVELANTGARELGFEDTGAVWRSGYDMLPEAFSEEIARLVKQLQPLYEAMHCHVRAKLNEHYGDAVAPSTGPIPAHLLGNMWAQSWENVFPLMGLDEADQAYDLTEIIETRGMSELDMTRTAEQFFISLGLGHLPQTFWERSMFTRPRDREVVCYASAWQIDAGDDVRLKMCIQRNAEDFQTLHHELGHNYYQLAYRNRDFLYQGSANDGFHEAVGDTLALSVGPEYLTQIGFIDESEASGGNDIALLLKSALDRVAAMPWAYLVDQWRWRVFSGDITPQEYNAAWWSLRERYQGVTSPVERPETYFDAGAKYHVPANTPYTRYFLARVLQFQFHRALCDIAGHEGPLHRCSIYGSEAAGARLAAMMEMGQSRPWQDALEALTGMREMDATAVTDYYAPLKRWLDQQNEGRQCGWSASPQTAAR